MFSPDISFTSSENANPNISKATHGCNKFKHRLRSKRKQEVFKKYDESRVLAAQGQLYKGVQRYPVDLEFLSHRKNASKRLKTSYISRYYYFKMKTISTLKQET